MEALLNELREAEEYFRVNAPVEPGLENGNLHWRLTVHQRFAKQYGLLMAASSPEAKAKAEASTREFLENFNKAKAKGFIKQ